MVRKGRVSVDGVVAKTSDQKVDEVNAVITVDGVVIAKKRRMVALLNKPMGYVTSTEDPRDPTVMALVPEEWEIMDLFPVGRLDKDTEGLLIFTNDGDLAHRLISPKHEVEKVYYAEHVGSATEEDVVAFKEGLLLKDGLQCKSAKLESLGEGKSLITVTEGKYHQVRRMMASRGMTVTYLKRVKEGGVSLGDLEKGKMRELLEEEEALLFS